MGRHRFINSVILKFGIPKASIYEYSDLIHLNVEINVYEARTLRQCKTEENHTAWKHLKIVRG